MSKDDRELIERIAKYIREYEDAPTWGGPTMYPAAPSVADLRAILALLTRLEALQAQPVGEGKLTMTISLTEREQEAIERLMAEQELSRPQIFKCALREYQMGHERRKAGETISWSGDEQRLRDFAGPTLTASPPVVEREADELEYEFELEGDEFALSWPDGRWLVAHGTGKIQFGKSPRDPAIPIRTMHLDAILALTPVEGVGEREARTEYGWLIERDGHGGLRYATPRSWTADHMKALRFARKVDAEEFAASRQDWSTDIRITEHAWD